MAAHPGETCAQYEDRQQFIRMQMADGFDGEKESAAKLTQKGTKHCPRAGCGVLIEKNGGCNHMRCELSCPFTKPCLLTNFAQAGAAVMTFAGYACNLRQQHIMLVSCWIAVRNRSLRV